MRKPLYDDPTGWTSQGDELMERKLQKQGGLERYPRHRLTLGLEAEVSVPVPEDDEITYHEGSTREEEAACLSSLIHKNIEKERENIHDKHPRSPIETETVSDDLNYDFSTTRLRNSAFDTTLDGTVTWKPTLVKPQIPRAAGAGTRAARTVGSYFVHRQVQQEALALETHPTPTPRTTETLKFASSNPEEFSRLKKRRLYGTRGPKDFYSRPDLEERAMNTLSRQIALEKREVEERHEYLQQLRRQDHERLIRRKQERMLLEMKAGARPTPNGTMDTAISMNE